MSRTLERLDGLVLDGAITGYTIEPAPAYLRAGRPTLSYSMYAFDRAGRANLNRFLHDMAELGADLKLHRNIGCTLAAGRLQRTRQLTAVAWFRGLRPLQNAIRVLNRRYLSGAGEAMQGSWRYPDARICGVSGRIARTIPAVAHDLGLRGGSAVVLSRSRAAPLPGMRSQPVRLLQCWRSYLEHGR